MKPIIRFLSILYYIFIVQTVFSQKALHQPIIGAVTDSSAKILFFSDTLVKYNIELHSDVGVLAINYQTIDSSYFCNVLTLKPLPANTKHFYTLTIDGDSTEYKGSFSTFPKTDSHQEFSFVFGSCTEQRQDFDIFKIIKAEQPAFFIHLGDWLYNHYYNSDSALSEQITKINLKDKFIERYQFLADFLQTTPIDYIFDDEDGIYDDFSTSTYSTVNYNNKKVDIKEIPYPDSLKTILKSSLANFFPSYDEVNSQQSYHSFMYGNAEFFVIDNRSTRTPNTEIFSYNKKGKLEYKNTASHQLLDSIQLNWLLNGLKNSKAQWKFIISGVTFNRSYKKVFNICMRLQNRVLPGVQKNGAYIAAGLSSMWFAFPNTQEQLINFCNANTIKNVIVLSGDAHSAAIDDGKNAGFPEIMAGGLAQKNSKIAGLIYNNFKLNLWNQGGQGIGNSNYNHAYGKVTVNKNNAVVLEIIDDKKNIIANYTLEDGFIPKKYNFKKQTKINKTFTFRKKIRIGFYQLLGKNKIK